MGCSIFDWQLLMSVPGSGATWNMQGNLGPVTKSSSEWLSQIAVPVQNLKFPALFKRTSRETLVFNNHPDYSLDPKQP